MDNIGDWLYIIIIAVAGISSLLKNLKKKKDYSETKLPIPMPEQDAYPIPPKPQKKIKTIPPPIPNKYKQKTGLYPQLIEGQRQLNTSEEALAFDQNTITTTIADQFDLKDVEEFRKAIIYSEIINRKY